MMPYTNHCCYLHGKPPLSLHYPFYDEQNHSMLSLKALAEC